MNKKNKFYLFLSRRQADIILGLLESEINRLISDNYFYEGKDEMLDAREMLYEQLYFELEAQGFMEGYYDDNG